MELYEHQRELLDLALTHNVMLCSPQRVGKTFVSAVLMRRQRQASRPGSFVVALAATSAERFTLYQELCRLDGTSVVLSSDTSSEVALDQALEAARRPETPSVAMVLAPSVLMQWLRTRRLEVMQLALLVLENPEAIAEDMPALFRMLFTSEQDVVPHLFATTKKAATQVQWDPRKNLLLPFIQVFNVVPVLSPSIVRVLQGKEAPAYPPLFAERFKDKEPMDNDAIMAQNDAVREFLQGRNAKNCDLVRIFRAELEMGNSAAVYDDKKKQDRVNRFISDCENVRALLGEWCLLKFVELELQANIQACIVEDSDNINHRRRQQQQHDGANGRDDDEDIVMQEEDDNTEDSEVQEASFTNQFAKHMEGLDTAFEAKIRPILKVISWLSKQANQVGLQAASPRLLAVSRLVRNRFLNGGTLMTRCWVFAERRSHCRLVSEYLTDALQDLSIPPCCSMLGNKNARIARSLHFSTNLKVLRMFNTAKTKVLVTTSVVRESVNVPINPVLCDLAVVMDELLEPKKLLEFGRCAHSATGAINYVLPEGNAATKRFKTLLCKLQEMIRIDAEVEAENRALTDANMMQTSSIDLDSQHVMMPKVVLPKESTYELVLRDTGAVLNLENAETILSQFCDTIPGLQTFDRRPQYNIKRLLASTGLAAHVKAAKKKKFKYNCKLDDKIDDLKSEAEARAAGNDGSTDSDTNTQDIQYTADVVLPRLLGIKKNIQSPKVASAEDSKRIVAFKACSELLKKGFLDRNFHSLLIQDQVSVIHDSTDLPSDVQMAVDATMKGDGQSTTVITEHLDDMTTQDSYDLPPVGADELGLQPIRKLLQNEENAHSDTITMYLYGLGGLQYAILASNVLFTGATNTGWRYDFATSDVMEPTIKPVTLQKKPIMLHLSKVELQNTLHFHLVTMRLACMGIDDALRDVQIEGDQVWQEFSEQNDKGYLVVPSLVDPNTQAYSLDWSVIQDTISKPLVLDAWPLPSVDEWPPEEWVFVPKNRHNVMYVIKCLAPKSAADVITPLLADDEAWKKHLKSKSQLGEARLGHWHVREQLQEADLRQPLVHGIEIPTIVPLIRRVMQRNNNDGSVSQSKTRFNERLLLPQYATLLSCTKTRFFEAVGIVPLLYEFERKCQMSHLMTTIGLEIDLSLLDAATSKPAYERLEILGDTFLKLETSWFMYEYHRELIEEGALTQLRRDIIRNDRLIQFALKTGLHHYILYPAEIEQKPFIYWKPSCMGKTPESISATSKWIADIVEAICGAYLTGNGEESARSFLRWVGVSVPDAPHQLAKPYYPATFPTPLDVDMTNSSSSQIGFSCKRFKLERRMTAIQERLKYQFRNKKLLLEAITHHSVGALPIEEHLPDGSMTKTEWRGNYERLEYLGDAIIEYLTLSFAFMEHDKWPPGALSQWKSATVSNDALGKTALRCFGVDECMLVGRVCLDSESLETMAKIERKYKRTIDMECEEQDVSGSQEMAPSITSNAIGVNLLCLPKMFGDVFESLVAAVFLDSEHDLHQVRDVFFGPLLETVGHDALAYVCHESGLAMEDDGMDLEDLPFCSDEDDA